jgi:hypothetical protein
VFLFEDIVSHVVAETRWAGWQWFDSPRHLAGYLLHLAVPDLAAWWFDESSYRDERARRTLREMAESATGADQEDRFFFLSIAADLEAVLAGPDPVDFEDISRVLERFATRFEKTSKWDFTFQAFPNTVAAGAALLEETGELMNPMTREGFTESEWLDLCARAGTDPAASEVVTETFEDAFSL